MTRQSRLRVQKKKRGRWILLYLCLIGIFVALSQYFNQKYNILSSVKEMFGETETSISGSTSFRGAIFDRNLKQVAVTQERVAVFVRTREVDSITDTAIALASAISLDSNKLINQMESGALRLWVAEDVSKEQEEAVKKLNLPGVHFQREKKRFYPHGAHGAHLIGFVEDGIGLSGVEYHYDRLLATRKSQQQKAQKPLSIGQDLVLTLDMKIQSILEGLVEEMGRTEDGSKVGAYLVESKTGELIAGAQYPGFDPNSFTKYDRKAIENLFFEPLFLPDKFRLFLRDAASFYALGEVDSTPGKWAISAPSESLGSQYRLWEWLGMGENSKADFFTPKIGTEPSGLNQIRVKSDSPVFGMIPEATTPMNLLSAFSVLLDGKFDHSPYLVKEVLDLETRQKVLLQTGGEAVEVSSDFPEASLPAVKRLFTGQVYRKDTSAKYFRDEVLTVTPVNGGLWSFGVNDVCFVTLDGGSNALNMLVVIKRPVVRPETRRKKLLEVESIVDSKARRISILHQVAGSVEDVLEPELLGVGNYQRITVKPGKTVDSSLRVPKVEANTLQVMPDLVGMSLRKSLRILQGVAMEINIEGTGRVVRQIPSAGVSLKKVQSCRLILENKEIIKPEIISKSKQQKS